MVGVLLSPFIIGIFAVPLCTPLANAVDAHLNLTWNLAIRKTGFGNGSCRRQCPDRRLMGNLLLLSLSFLPLSVRFLGSSLFPLVTSISALQLLRTPLIDVGTRLVRTFVLKRFIGASWLIGFQAQVSFTLPFLNLIGCPLVVMSGVKTVSDLLKRGQSALTE